MVTTASEPTPHPASESRVGPEYQCDVPDWGQPSNSTTEKPDAEMTAGALCEGRYLAGVYGWKATKWYNAVVTKRHDNGNLDLLFDDGDTETNVVPRFVRRRKNKKAPSAATAPAAAVPAAPTAAEASAHSAPFTDQQVEVQLAIDTARRLTAAAFEGMGAADECEVQRLARREGWLRAAPRVVERGPCGTFGCTLPDRHGGLHQFASPPTKRRVAPKRRLGEVCVEPWLAASGLLHLPALPDIHLGGAKGAKVGRGPLGRQPLQVLG